MSRLLVPGLMVQPRVLAMPCVTGRNVRKLQHHSARFKIAKPCPNKGRSLPPFAPLPVEIVEAICTSHALPSSVTALRRKLKASESTCQN